MICAMKRLPTIVTVLSLLLCVVMTLLASLLLVVSIFAALTLNYRSRASWGNVSFDAGCLVIVRSIEEAEPDVPSALQFQWEGRGDAIYKANTWFSMARGGVPGMTRVNWYLLWAYAPNGMVVVIPLWPLHCSIYYLCGFYFVVEEPRNDCWRDSASTAATISGPAKTAVQNAERKSRKRRPQHELQVSWIDGSYINIGGLSRLH